MNKGVDQKSTGEKSGKKNKGEPREKQKKKEKRPGGESGLW